MKSELKNQMLHSWQQGWLAEQAGHDMRDFIQDVSQNIFKNNRYLYLFLLVKNPSNITYMPIINETHLFASVYSYQHHYITFYIVH